jgi:hypothetical protein
MGTEEPTCRSWPLRRDGRCRAGYTRLEDLTKYRYQVSLRAPRVLRIVASTSGGRSFTCPPPGGHHQRLRITG